MKNILHLSCLLCAAVVLSLVGCAKKETVDTAPLQKSFKTAEPAKHQTADQAVASIKAGDYGAALTSLQKLTLDSTLTKEQQDAVKETLASLQKTLADTAQKMTEDGKKAIDDVKKAMPKL